MSARVRIDGVAADGVSAMDRGLAYGDGLFESIRFVGAAAPLWSRHMHRLAASCQRLRIPLPDPCQLWQDAIEVSRGLPHSVVRITLTRGIGERGYAPPPSPQPMRMVAAFEAPRFDPQLHAGGVAMRLCDIRLAQQPLLAGMKHLNRLEQVLARAEWSDPAIAEGVLCDAAGRVISATAANLFVVLDGALQTPALDQCGIAGVARAEVLATLPHTRVGELTPGALRDASEVFLSSSVRGIVPVRAIGERIYEVGPLTRQLQQHWHTLGFFTEHDG